MQWQDKWPNKRIHGQGNGEGNGVGNGAETAGRKRGGNGVEGAETWRKRGQ